MKFEWDEKKRHSNIVKHGVDFSVVARIDWDNAYILEDTRKEYGEPRFWAFGKISNRLYFVAFTIRGEAYRIICFRRASNKEVARYGQDSQGKED